MVYHRYGEVFRKIRTQKNLPLAYFQKLGVEKGDLSRFERGKTMMGLERIDAMLQEMNVSLAEYELFLNNFAFDYHEEFLQELEQADIKQDNQQLARLYQEARNYGYKWLSCAVKARQEKLNAHEKQEITDFLQKVEMWGYFELSLTYFLMDNLETETLIQVMQLFEQRNKSYLGIPKYRRRIFQIAYRAVIVFISRGEQDQAELILKKTAGRSPEIIDFYIENLRLMTVGIYEQMFGNFSAGAKQIAEGLDIFERLGYSELRRFYEKRTWLILGKEL